MKAWKRMSASICSLSDPLSTAARPASMKAWPFVLRPLRAAFGGEPRRQAVQHRPHLIEISDEIDVQRRDDQAPAGGLPDQSAVPQQQQSLLHRLARHPIGARQLVLDQPRVGRQVAVDDLGNDSVYNLFHEGWLGLELGHAFSEGFVCAFSSTAVQKNAIALYSNSEYAF